MTQILTDNAHYFAIASAIRGKNGLSASYTPSEMAAAITSIPTGGTAILGSKAISANGTYYASADSLDGFSYVEVSVPSGGGGNEDGVIERTGTSYANATAGKVGSYAFYLNSVIQSVSFASASLVGVSAFYSCANLEEAHFLACESVASYAFYNCSLAIADFPLCTYVGALAFYNAKLSSINFPSLISTDVRAFAAQGARFTSVDLPALKYAGQSMFYECQSLVSANLPECSFLSEAAFYKCFSLIDVNLQKCEMIGASALYFCQRLSQISLPSCKSIYGNAFALCYKLTSLDLTGVSSVPTLANVNAFNSTPLYNYSASAGQWGSIYVPSSLYDAFLSANNWSNASIAARIVSV